MSELEHRSMQPYGTPSHGGDSQKKTLVERTYMGMGRSGGPNIVLLLNHFI